MTKDFNPEEMDIVMISKVKKFWQNMKEVTEQQKKDAQSAIKRCNLVIAGCKLCMDADDAERASK